MNKIILDDISFFYLNEDEFCSSEVKNQCIVETQTTYLACLTESVAAEEVQRMLVEQKSVKECLILCVDTTQKDDMASDVYEMGLLMEPERIRGLLFTKTLIRQCGGFAAFLFQTGNLEFVCRTMSLGYDCKFQSIEVQKPQESVPAQEYALAEAYLVRYHMNTLRKRGIMERVFGRICGRMQERGCFGEFQQYLNTFLSREEIFDEYASYTAPFLVLRGDDTCMGVLQNFADDLADALAGQAQAVIVAGDDSDQYDALQNKNYKGIVGFQTRALEIEFFRRMKGKKFHFWMDYPLHFKGVLRNLPEDYYILCQDADYARQIREHYHTPNALQFPPGGIYQGQVLGERPYDIVFVGSYFADDWSELTKEQLEFYDFMIANSTLTFEQGLCKLLNITKEESYTEDFEERIYRLKPACRAVIGHFREKVLETILEAGFTVQVYGQDWELFCKKLSCQAAEQLIIHPQATVRESLVELKKAKIGLNVMSWHKAGMTERIANIMLSGAVCLSDETVFLKEQTRENEELVLYRLDQLEELPGKISELLDRTEKREEIARMGYEKARESFSWDVRAKELIALAQKKQQVQIFVATHVAFKPPQNRIYTPLHVGRKGKQDLGYLGDDTGENISELNFLYGELTGLFWIWQNVHDIPYVGLCHYRRYFINENMTEMKQEEYLEILKDCDAIVPKHMLCEGGVPYYEQFGKAHNSRDLDAVGRALKRLYPEYGEAYDKAMEGNIFYWGNLMVTSLEILKAYSEWLFTIFAEAGEDIDVSGYDDYHKRVYGFLSEQMFYVFAMANGLHLCETAVGVSAEKAETKELKKILRDLLKQGRNEEAKKILSEQLEKRPDLLLPGSDIGNELLEICNMLK